MKLAVIKTGGKQYKVKEGQVVSLEKLKGEKGDNVSFVTLMTFDEKGSDINVGAPELGEVVSGEVVSQYKADKVSVVKFKNKTRYRRNVGHRQQLTKVKITKIA